MFLKMIKKHPISNEPHIIIEECDRIKITNSINNNDMKCAYIYAFKDDRVLELCHSVDFDENGESNQSVYIMNTQGQTIDTIYQ